MLILVLQLSTLGAGDVRPSETKNMKHYFKRLSSILCLALFVILGLWPSSGALFADRIYLKNGVVLRGKVLSIGARDYKFEGSSGGKPKNVAKNEIIKVTFSRGRSERGYADFFARLLVGVGQAEYGIKLNTSREEPELKSTHPPLRLGLEAGWQLIDYSLALHGGFDYSYSNFYSSSEPTYSYLTLSAGLSYYFSIPKLSFAQNMYISSQIRTAQSGSASFSSKFAEQEANVSIEGEGLGYGISLGKEWYTDTWKIWGVALTYTHDSLKSQQKIIQESNPIIRAVLPNDALGSEVTETQTELDYIGITFSLTYD